MSQQATLPISATHPTRSLQGLARQIALPHEFAPQRLPSFPALERTAVMSFSQPTTLNCPTGQQTKVLIMRQACYPTWAEQADMGTGYSISMLSTVVATSAVTSGATYPIPAISGFNTANVLASPGTLGLANTTYNQTVPPFATDAGRTYFYHPGGATTYVVNASTGVFATSETVRLRVMRWTSPGEEVPENTPSIGIAATYTGAGAVATGVAPGWLRVLDLTIAGGSATTHPSTVVLSAVVQFGVGGSYTASTLNYGVVTSNAFTGRVLVPLAVPTEFYNSQLPWFATRTTACSFLGTNVSQVLNKGGTILAGRVSPNVMNAWSVTSAYVQALHPAEKAFLALETGTYTFVPPSTDLGMFWDHTSTPMANYTTTAYQAWPQVRLDNDSLYHVMYIIPSAVDEQLACTTDWHIEFRTSSALFQIGLSTMLLETLHQAQISLAEVGYFFENINHKALLGKVVAATRKYGPTVASVIPGPAGLAARAAMKIISNRPKPGPAGTSGAASGISAPARKAKAGKQGKDKKKKR